MIPGGVLSSEAQRSQFMYPVSRRSLPLVDYEPGGPALNTGYSSRETVWKLEYRDGGFYVGTDSTPEVLVHSAPDVTMCSLSFDQNMQPVLAWESGGSGKLYWYDLAQSAFVTTDLGPVSTPRVSMEFGSVEVLLTYVRDGGLYIRGQADKYATETLLASGVPPKITAFGMGSNYRMQWKL